MKREACPKCRAEGRDTAGDNVQVYPGGRKYCYAGHGYLGRNGEDDMESEFSEITEVSTLTVEECRLKNPLGADPARGISMPIVDLYQIRVSYDTDTGKVCRVYYPYYNDDGEITAYKIRRLPKRFSISGKIEGLFGKNTLKVKNPTSALIITEGEEDALAMKEILSRSTLGKTVVCSLPHGAAFDKVLQSDYEFINKFSAVALCLDNDKVGKAAAKLIAGWLSGFIKQIKIVELPRKDASECLSENLVEEVIEAIKNAAYFVPEGIVKGSDITLEDIKTEPPKGFSSPYKELDMKLRGFRKGELVTVCAASGVGKSTFSREIAWHLAIEHNATVCHIALEAPLINTVRGYIALWNKVNPAAFNASPHDGSVLSDEQIEEGRDGIAKKMYFFNHFGSINTTSFREKLLYYARIGVDFIILDHLSMIISGSDVPNERKEIDKVMTDLASMVVETGVGIISVVHLKRRETGNKEAGLSEGGKVSLTDLRGSAALEQLSWAVIALERDTQADDGSEDYSTIRVLKNRTWGYTGKAGRLLYDHSVGRLFPAPSIEPSEPVPVTEEIEESHLEEKSEESGSEALAATLASLFGQKEAAAQVPR